ncbi:hypothetical protein [Haloarchaeobius sp. HRN-SO-5]|uniref:hypothetical protein n=1 Tax=Haloarchaeobius sp. HRN-SO-5 TaxID=3446118 RepID=UPI003EB77AE6
MKRRRVLATLSAAASGSVAGCSASLPSGTDPPDAASVVESYHYEETELVVQFSEEFAIKQASLYDSSSGTQYASIEHPSSNCRFQVVIPDRLETYATESLHLEVKTATGTVTEWIWEGPTHGHTSAVDVGPEGQAQFDITNQGETPLLVRFVAITGDVPNPTVDPQHESFDRSALGFGPGVLGTGSNRPQSPNRSDLVISPGETAPFETTYAPFAVPEDSNAAWDGADRTGEITIVEGSGSSAKYDFTYRLGDQ